MSQGPIHLLDGGMGRELKRSGAPFRQPEWSALALIESPEHVLQAHEAFIRAGARVVTTNSYAVVPFHLGQTRFAEQGRALADRAGRLARQAASQSAVPVRVAGSLPPALGSYRPDLFDHQASVAIHQELIAGLQEHVDVWLAETQSSTAEVQAAAQALGERSKPLWVSYTLIDDADHAPRLRSGESVADGVRCALSVGAKAVLFNCSQPEVMGAALEQAQAVLGDLEQRVELGVYANAFPPVSQEAEANTTLLDIRADLGPEPYLDWARNWVAVGATIIGGCCGIGPEHIEQLHRHFVIEPEGITS